MVGPWNCQGSSPGVVSWIASECWSIHEAIASRRSICDAGKLPSPIGETFRSRLPPFDATSHRVCTSSCFDFSSGSDGL